MTRPSPAFRVLLAATAVAAWALVAVGGLVRVSRSGLGCPDWPLCNGRPVPLAEKEPIIEYAHRLTATTVTVLLLVSAIWAFRRYRDRPHVVVSLALAVVLVPFQAVLGAVVVWLELPAGIVGLHFMVGLVFLATIVYAAAAALRGTATASRGYRSVALWLAGAGLVLVSLGASVVATDAEEACGRQWPLCNGSAVGGGGLAVLQVVHRTFGYAVLGLAAALFALALRRRGPLLAGIAPALLAVAQIAFGVGIVLTHDETVLHDTLRVLHVAGSGAVWASIVSVFAVALLPPSTDAPVTELEPAARPSTLLTTAR